MLGRKSFQQGMKKVLLLVVNGGVIIRTSVRNVAGLV